MRLLIRLVLGAALIFAAAPATARDFRLSILHTNDVHAAYGGFDAEGRPCRDALCPGGNGGVARLKTLVDELRDSHTLLLDAGDQFTGTLFFSRFDSRITTDVMNSLGYDAAIPGNHEFDNGCAGLADYAPRLNMPYMAANLDMPGLRLAPWTVVEKGGRSIGIVGLVTPETLTSSSPCAGTVFTDPEEALRQAVAELRARHVNIIIALSHLGVSEDMRLAQSVNGVDIYVGGHSHTLLGEAPLPGVEAEGKYPLDFRTPAGEPSLVVSDWWALHQLGRLNVAFNRRGHITAWNGAPVLLDDTWEPDSYMLAKMEAYAGELKDWLNTGLGRLSMPGRADGELLDGPDIRICRREECLSGSLSAEAAAWGVGAQVGMINGGSVRASLKTGTVTKGDLMETLPYEEKIQKALVYGALLREMLEWGLGGLEDNKGRFMQVHGLRYAFDPAKPVGQRLLSVEVPENKGWRPLRDDESLTLAINGFIAQGGDGYSMLKGLPWQESDISGNAALEKFLGDGKAAPWAWQASISVRGQ